MNHFGIGKLDESRRIHLPIDILHPINIVPDVAVWGMYYPKSLASAGDGERCLDFVLSPIPFDLWPRTARLTVRTKHRPGAFRRVTEFLKQSNVTILVSEGSRSAHRYDTWTMIVALERRVIKNASSPNSDIGKYSVNQKGYGGAAKKFQNLEKKLHESLSGEGLLHEEPEDVKLAVPVQIEPHNAMSYFYYVANEGRPADSDWFEYRPFRMKCERGGILRSDDERRLFEAIADHIHTNQGDKILPCAVFAEAQRDDMNMRAVLIDEEESNHYFSMTARFKRSGPPPSSRGLCDFVLDSMKDEFNIWGINNLTINFSEDSEEGQMKLIAKDGDVTRKTNEQRQKFLAKSINRDKLPAELRMITEIKLVCYNLSSLERPGGVEAEPVAVGAYDVFLSYSSLDSDYATELQSVLEQAGLKVFRDRNHLELGSRFDPSIRNALLSAHEIVILCSPSSIASDWVKRELGAAWALGKAVTPVVLHMEIDNLPSELRDRQASYFEEMVRDRTGWRFISEFKQRNML